MKYLQSVKGFGPRSGLTFYQARYGFKLLADKQLSLTNSMFAIYCTKLYQQTKSLDN